MKVWARFCGNPSNSRSDISVQTKEVTWPTDWLSFTYSDITIGQTTGGANKLERKGIFERVKKMWSWHLNYYVIWSHFWDPKLTWKVGRRAVCNFLFFGPHLLSAQMIQPFLGERILSTLWAGELEFNFDTGPWKILIFNTRSDTTRENWICFFLFIWLFFISSFWLMVKLLTNIFYVV